jgi:hypothetical protein
MQSRFPNENWENGRTGAPYSIFQGFDDVFVEFDAWLARTVGVRVHGHLFAPDRAHFAGGERIYNGCLSDSAALRDYDPKAFLTSLMWNTRGERQCFLFGPRDNQALNWFIAGDVNAQISVISGAWAIPLFRAKGEFSDLRREAARLQKIESDQLHVLRSPWTKARTRIWTLAEFLENPVEPLQSIIDVISPTALRRLTEVPTMTDLTGFGRFLQELRNQGMQPTLVGDVPLGEDPRPALGRRGRPYLVTAAPDAPLRPLHRHRRDAHGLELPRGEPERDPRRHLPRRGVQPAFHRLEGPGRASRPDARRPRPRPLRADRGDAGAGGGGPRGVPLLP